jgi:hypothetical protein
LKRRRWRRRRRACDVREPLVDLLLDRGAFSIELGQTMPKLADIGRRFENSLGRGQSISHVLLCHRAES